MVAVVGGDRSTEDLLALYMYLIACTQPLELVEDVGM